MFIPLLFLFKMDQQEAIQEIERIDQAIRNLQIQRNNLIIALQRSRQQQYYERPTRPHIYSQRLQLKGKNKGSRTIFYHD